MSDLTRHLSPQSLQAMNTTCHNTLRLAEQLISKPSVTPDDAGCLDLIADELKPLHFVCEFMDSGPDTFRVRNLWALQVTPTWCLPGHSRNGTATPSRPPTKTVSCLGEVRAT